MLLFGISAFGVFQMILYRVLQVVELFEAYQVLFVFPCSLFCFPFSFSSPVLCVLLLVASQYYDRVFPVLSPCVRCQPVSWCLSLPNVFPLWCCFVVSFQPVSWWSLPNVFPLCGDFLLLVVSQYAIVFSLLSDLATKTQHAYQWLHSPIAIVWS